MPIWCPTTFVVLLAVPFTFSRHLEHTKRNGRRHEDLRHDVDSESLFPRTHLRLHAKPPKVLHMHEGGSEFLECQAGGSPLPRIYWLKNGEQMTQLDLADELELVSDSPSSLHIGATSSRLYLDCISMGDEAEYTCVAESANHRESTTTSVTVSSSDDKGCRDRKQFGQAPRIHTWTKTALETQGQDVKVVCRAKGDPKPTVKWLDPHGDAIDDNSTKYEMFSNGDLTIRNLKWADMGNYVCLAENIHGTARVETFVYPASPEDK